MHHASPVRHAGRCIGLLALASTALIAPLADAANPPSEPPYDATSATAAASGATRELVLNGDFEQTVFTTCAMNLSNERLSDGIPHVGAFGVAGQVDVLIASEDCAIGAPPPGGRVSIALASEALLTIEDGAPAVPRGDAISFELSSPIIAGHAYTLSFDGRCGVYPWAPDTGRVQFGLSGAAHVFGSQIVEVSPTPDVWTRFTHRFIAPLDATHLTLRQAADGDVWNQIDRVSLVDDGPVRLSDATRALLASRFR